jgi:hypothetical protein
VDSRYEVAYREELRAVDDQAKTVENIRARAGTLFSAAGVTTAIRRHPHGGGLTLGAVAFGKRFEAQPGLGLAQPVMTPSVSIASTFGDCP